jgi:hypothetical protein
MLLPIRRSRLKTLFTNYAKYDILGKVHDNYAGLSYFLMFNTICFASR